MKLLSALLAFVVAALVSTQARALPNLQQPTYNYAFQAPAASAFDTRYLNGKPAGFWSSRLDYHLFEPRYNNGSAVTEAPVIVYLHGATTSPTPKQIKQQIEHYVRSGFTVVYPLMCTWPCLDYDKQEDAAIKALKAAIKHLEGTGRVRPTRDANGDPEYVFVAHSLGTMMAARIASKLGYEDATVAGAHAPKALIFHDPAGHAVSVGSIVIKDILPIEPVNLQYIRPDTLQLIYAQPLSPTGANGVDTVSRLHENSPAQRKFAWVVPHQCVTSSNGALSYACPSGMATASADSVKSFEKHDTTTNIFVSHHDSAAADTYLNAMSRVGIVDHTTACVAEATGGSVVDACTGTTKTYSGVWRENNVSVRNADVLFPYPLP